MQSLTYSEVQTMLTYAEGPSDLQWYISISCKGVLVDTHITSLDPTDAISGIVELYPEYRSCCILYSPYVGGPSQPLKIAYGTDGGFHDEDVI